MALITLNSPATEVVDLAYAKQFLRVDGTDEDVLIADLVSVARQQLENIINRSLIARTLRYRGIVPNAYCLSLPCPPLLAVNTVTLYDVNGQSILIPSSDYVVNVRRDPGELHLKSGKNWSMYIDTPCDLEIEFMAGYGVDPHDVPLPLKQALLLLLAQHYEHRDSADQPPVPMMVDALLMPYRWVRL